MEINRSVLRVLFVIISVFYLKTKNSHRFVNIHDTCADLWQ